MMKNKPLPEGFLNGKHGFAVDGAGLVVGNEVVVLDSGFQWNMNDRRFHYVENPGEKNESYMPLGVSGKKPTLGNAADFIIDKVFIERMDLEDLQRDLGSLLRENWGVIEKIAKAAQAKYDSAPKYQ
ncbi:hypothetical protein ACFL1B_00805 [Nanoarchaeota archaeon]